MLERELKYFNDNKDEYLRIYPNMFVVISDDKFVGSYTTQEQAYEAGIKACGLKPFLLKQVLPDGDNTSVPAYSLGLLTR